jgi:hypothetical protein
MQQLSSSHFHLFRNFIFTFMKKQDYLSTAMTKFLISHGVKRVAGKPGNCQMGKSSTHFFHMWTPVLSACWLWIESPVPVMLNQEVWRREPG